MATKVYGASDDLIEFDGDVSGEVGFYQSRHDEDAEIYSDVAHFKDGLKWAYRAREWEAAVYAGKLDFINGNWEPKP